MDVGTSMATAAAAPALAAVISNPADVAKTRLNMDRELTSVATRARFTGTADCIRQTWAAEGMAGIQRGLGMAMVREASKNSFRIGLYDPLVRYLHRDSGPPPWSIRIGAGAVTGAVSAFIVNPLDLAKVRLQLDPSHPRGAASTSTRVFFAGLWASEGARGLWRGTPVNMGRSVMSTSTQLSTNARIKELFAALGLRPGAPTDATAALGAGAATVCTMNPIDVVRTRLYSQPVDPATGKGSLYRGAAHCVASIAQTEGLFGFYKGSLANFMRVGPHTVITFTILGAMRRAIVAARAPPAPR